MMLGMPDIPRVEKNRRKRVQQLFVVGKLGQTGSRVRNAFVHAGINAVVSVVHLDDLVEIPIHFAGAVALIPEELVDRDSKVVRDCGIISISG